MQDIIDTLNANIAQATADATQQQGIIGQAQIALDADNANIAEWTAQIALLQDPTVIAAITTVETALQTAQNTAQPAQVTP